MPWCLHPPGAEAAPCQFALPCRSHFHQALPVQTLSNGSLLEAYCKRNHRLATYILWWWESVVLAYSCSAIELLIAIEHFLFQHWATYLYVVLHT